MKKFIVYLLVLISPLWIIGISAKITLNSWFIDFEYSKKDFPKDRYGLCDKCRKELALIGLKAVLSEEGLKEFENAKLPSGRKAFRQKEVKHMKDVNRFLSMLFPLTYFLIFTWIIGLIFFKEYRKKILIYSGAFTVLLIISLGVLVFTNYDKAFEIFHNYTFGSSSWKFKSSDTLLRIYPMKFWFDGTIAVTFISLIISLLLILTGMVLKKNAKTKTCNK